MGLQGPICKSYSLCSPSGGPPGGVTLIIPVLCSQLAGDQPGVILMQHPEHQMPLSSIIILCKHQLDQMPRLLVPRWGIQGGGPARGCRIRQLGCYSWCILACCPSIIAPTRLDFTQISPIIGRVTRLLPKQCEMLRQISRLQA